MSIVDEICDRQTNGCLQQPAKRAEEVNSCEGPAGGLSADRRKKRKEKKRKKTSWKSRFDRENGRDLQADRRDRDDQLVIVVRHNCRPIPHVFTINWIYNQENSS